MKRTDTPLSQTQSTRRTFGLILIPIILLSFWIRVKLMVNDPMFVDELFEAAEVISRSLVHNLVNFRLDATLLHALITQPFAQLGWEPFLLRWASLLPGILSIPLTYRLGRLLFDRQVALLAAALLALSPAVIGSSIMIRGYALLVPLSLLSSIFLIQATKSGRNSQWLMFGLSITLLAFSHAFTYIVLVPIGIYVLWQILAIPPPYRGKLLKGALLALLVIGIGFAITLGLTFLSGRMAENNLQFSATWSGDLSPFQLNDLKASFLPFLNPLRRANFDTKTFGWQLFYYAGLVALGAVTGLINKEHRKYTIYLILIALLPLLLVAVALNFFVFHVFIRYFDFAIYSYAFLAAYAICWLGRSIGRDSRTVRLGVAALATLLLVYPAYAGLSTRYQLGTSQRMVQAAHYLQTHASPEDLIFCVARDDQRIDDEKRMDVEREKCLLGLHFYPDLALRTFAWQETDFITWQNLLTPENRCSPYYYHLPHPGLSTNCEEGQQKGPDVWLVFWQRLPSETPFAWDDSGVEAQFGNTRLLRLNENSTLRENLEAAGEIILSDDAVSPERATNNALALGHMYASQAQTDRTLALFEDSASNLDSMGDRDRRSAIKEAETLLSYLPYLGGTALPETRSGATWGDQIRLRGFTVQMEANQMDITSFWQAVEVPTRDYTFFLHWRDSQDATLAQQDFQVFDGRLPMTQWPSGNVIRENRTLDLPPLETGETYRLVLGIYDPDGGQRLPLTDLFSEEGDQSGENVLVLGQWP